MVIIPLQTGQLISVVCRGILTVGIMVGKSYPVTVNSHRPGTPCRVIMRWYFDCCRSLRSDPASLRSSLRSRVCVTLVGHMLMHRSFSLLQLLHRVKRRVRFAHWPALPRLRSSAQIVDTISASSLDGLLWQLSYRFLLGNNQVKQWGLKIPRITQ